MKIENNALFNRRHNLMIASVQLLLQKRMHYQKVTPLQPHLKMGKA